MRLSTRPVPRHDPRLIYAIQANRAGGLTVADIAAKHNLPLPTVLQLLRAPSPSCALKTPYEFRQGALPARAPAQVYWLGYIASSGRIFGENARGTLVLAIHPEDGAHVQTLLQDLIEGYANCEFVDSSLNGRQAYVRNPDLARVLLQWGIASSLEQTSIPLEFLPQALLPDFLRGYIEGSRLTRPFGEGRNGNGNGVPSPGSLRSLALAGSPALIEGLATALRTACSASGSMGSSTQAGLTQIVFPAKDGMRLLEYAYRLPVRSSPRAEKFVAHFARREPRRARETSRGQDAQPARR